MYVFLIFAHSSDDSQASETILKLADIVEKLTLNYLSSTLVLEASFNFFSLVSTLSQLHQPECRLSGVRFSCRIEPWSGLLDRGERGDVSLTFGLLAGCDLRPTMPEAKRLSDLPTGAQATIAGMPGGERALMRLREMGVVPGTRIQLVRRAPLGDPIEISLRGSLLSLRKSEADLITVTTD